MLDEDAASKYFLTKPRIFSSARPVKVNALLLSKDLDGSINTTQESKIDNLTQPKDAKTFSNISALAQYIGVNCSPDLCAPVRLFAPGSKEVTNDEIKHFSKVIRFLNLTRHDGLQFVPLFLATLKLVIFTDADFANARGLNSHLCFVIVMV